MDFYNLQESDHQLLEKMMNISPTATEFKDYLQRRFFDFEKVAAKNAILLIEEDPRLQCAMQRLIAEVNPAAKVRSIYTVEDLPEALEEQRYELLIANYYLSEDEIDYEFWEAFRASHPLLELIIFSHVNDREYFEMLDKMGRQGPSGASRPLPGRIKRFFEIVFGG